MKTLLILLAMQDALSDDVSRLRDNDIAVRDAAEAALVARGESAVAELRKLADVEPDTDVRLRLRRAVERLTGLDWMTDLDAALKKAAAEGKRVFVLGTPGELGGPT